MPAVKIHAKKMEKLVEEAIAKEFLTVIQQTLKVPIVEIFFFDIDKVYATDGQERCLMEIVGPERPDEVIEQL
jgi:hypothetical protein